ncbi:hypothetical protein QUB80_22610 [Chlorogloeopsis sp. ULAP01]|jgi:hypothetical protein|nr:hypothetical protein [Chlorogloeopsis sp. ULAP01]MDM9383484.1 hypothetical protein [Chlorogloeopsis sp. ULAP01]
MRRFIAPHSTTPPEFLLLALFLALAAELDLVTAWECILTI